MSVETTTEYPDAASFVLFHEAQNAEPNSIPSLFPSLYSELRRMAARQIARHGLNNRSPTTFVHEAYIDLAQGEATFPDEKRFLAYAARVIRGLIIDHVRQQQMQKRGGSFSFTSLGTDISSDVSIDCTQLLLVGDALEQLMRADPILAEIVDLKFFCGFSFTEIAAIYGSSERTVQRQWKKARIYLRQYMQRDSTPPEVSE